MLMFVRFFLLFLRYSARALAFQTDLFLAVLADPVGGQDHLTMGMEDGEDRELLGQTVAAMHAQEASDKAIRMHVARTAPQSDALETMVDAMQTWLSMGEHETRTLDRIHERFPLDGLGGSALAMLLLRRHVMLRNSLVRLTSPVPRMPIEVVSSALLLWIRDGRGKSRTLCDLSDFLWIHYSDAERMNEAIELLFASGRLRMEGHLVTLGSEVQA